MLTSQEHYDLIAAFERDSEFKGSRHEKEPKALWPKGRIYTDGALNEKFLAYRKGYALARAVYLQKAG